MASVPVPDPAPSAHASHTAPREAWILAGVLDGRAATPALGEDVAGLPHLFRLAGELQMAGVARAIVITREAVAPELIATLTADRRLARISIEVAAEAPAGGAGDAIVVVRGDRIFHRDLPKAAITAWTGSTARVAKVAGDEHDAVLVTDRATATALARIAAQPGALAAELRALGPAAEAPVPYLGFTAAAPDKKALRRVERQLVWSLRKSADGIASKLLNRRLSLPMTWLLMRTPVIPNHVTITALVCAMTGAVVIGQGGYLAGAIGMLLVNFGSIIDGVDGEIARLKFLFSRAGQWLDTIVDDIGNLCYSCGLAVNLHAAGVSWALPLWAVASVCFVLTQSSQYWLIARVYGSGDLAAIPWAFQSSEFLSQRPRGVLAWIKVTAPKLLKRDSALTIFTIFALAGHLDWILVAYCTGALVFFAVFFVQFARNLASVRRALRERR